VTANGRDQNVLSFKEQELYVPRDPLDLAAPKQSLEDMSIADARSYWARQQQSGNLNKQIKAELYIQQQLATPWTTAIFGLIGSTLGTTLRRVSSSTGFGISILIVLGYYFVAFLLSNLGNLGILTPHAAAWLPICIIAGIAGWLAWRGEHQT
ncbi:MAG TPA: LptF/LptG family permease, partial [Stenomitos sp.]